MKILGIHFSYDKNNENDENLIKLIKKIENVLKIWRTTVQLFYLIRKKLGKKFIFHSKVKH